MLHLAMIALAAAAFAALAGFLELCDRLTSGPPAGPSGETAAGGRRPR
jgi:hypothetical protein